MPTGKYIPILPVEPIFTPDYQRHKIPIDPPRDDPDAFPARCVHIHVDYIPTLIALCDYYVHPDAFTGDDQAREQAAQRFVMLQMLLMGSNMVCQEDTDMYLLRQSPVDPCILQQSIDNGLSWTDAFNYRLCFASQGKMSNYEAQQVINQANAEANALVEIYADDPTNIFTDGTFDGSPQDEFRNQAMCYAVNVFLAQLSMMVEDQIDNGTDWWDIVAKVAHASEYVGTLILEYLGVEGSAANIYWVFATLTATAVAHWVKEYAEQQGQDPDFSAILDSQFQQCLACAAMDVLGGNTPSIGLFAQIFDQAQCAGFSADVHALLAALCESEEVYLGFLDVVQGAYEALAEGQTFDCGCGDSAIIWDFTAESGSEPDTIYGPGQWYVPPGSSGCGTHVPDTGWVAGNEDTGQFTKHRGVYLHHDGISGTIARMRVYYDMEFSNYVLSDPGIIAYGADYSEYSIADVGQGNNRHIERTVSVIMSNNAIEFGLFCYIWGTDNPTWGGNVRVRRVELYGHDLALN